MLQKMDTLHLILRISYAVHGQVQPCQHTLHLLLEFNIDAML
jgi:hypothetical protein